MRPLRIVVCLIVLALVCMNLPCTQFVLAQESQQPSTSQSTVNLTVPRLIRITGFVRDAAGQPLTGSSSITFSLYQNQNDEAPAWQETQTLTLDSSGHYSVLLGSSSVSGLPLEIFSEGQARWLGIRPNEQSEQARILLLSVAYALKAADSDMLGGLPASAFVLANGQNSTQASQSGPQVTVSSTIPVALATSNATCSTVTSDGTGTANQITKFTTACNIENSAIFESGGNVGIGNKSPAGVLDVSGTSFFRGTLSSLGGINVASTGTATTSTGFTSNPLDLSASVYNTTLGRAINYMFQWQSEPTGNDSTNTGATLNLLYGVSGDVAETGLSISKGGIISFASGQTFPGVSGTVTSVATGAGLTGGPITGTGTISIPNAGVTNAMLADSSITVDTGTGLSGGGKVALGGTITLTNTAPSSGGTVTSVASGTGLTGGPITGSGTLSLNTTYTNGLYLQLAGGTLTGGLTGTTGTFSGAFKAAAGTFTGSLSASAGAVFPNVGNATATAGTDSNPLDLIASSYDSSTAAAIGERFRWQAEPTGNDTANPSASLHLLFGANGATPAETGLSVASSGVITFASGQTFPGVGTGTVTSVATGTGLTGGPITKTGTIGIATGGVTNAMLATPSITVTTGTGLSGGGTVALGGTITLTNTAPSSGGTVTSVSTGTGLTGGPITKTGTIGIATGGVTNAMLATPSITVNTGTGLSGGGSVALGGTITLTNTAPSSGGTVTSVASGTGLTGGPITGSGTLSLNTAYTNGLYLQLAGGTLTGALAGTSANFSGSLIAAGGTMPNLGTATAAAGFNSNPFDFVTSSYNSSATAAQPQRFRWQAEPTGNDTATPSGSLHLLFGSNGAAPAETGLSVASTGLITFATGQSFPGTGAGSVTSVATGAGLTGGPITKTGTLSIATGGVTNAMLATPSITVTAGSGLSGGGTVALGGTITLTNSAPSSGGTVTSVATGAGLTGGPVTKTGTIGIATGGVTNAMLATPSITVNTGTGLSGGGAVALGGTITLTNTAPSSGGTVTSVASGTGLTGGPITGSGTLSLNTTYTNSLYLQLAGGTLTGGLTGTTGTFSGALQAAAGTFTGALTASGGGILPNLGTASATAGFNSNPLDLIASSYSSTTAAAIGQRFRWQAEPTGNDTTTPSGSLHLLFGSNGAAPAETGLSVANNGVITFATGQTFPGTGTGTITKVTAGAGLTGGGATGNVTLSLLNTCSSGQTLIWSGTTWACGSYGAVSGTTDGIAYFAGPATVTSTAAPTNGQILIGSTGAAPVLSTLTGGQNVTITNGAGSIEISANGPAALPFFATGGQQTGASLSPTQNATTLWGFLLPYSVTTTQITYSVTTADNTANTYDIGVFNNSGTLVLDLGSTAGTTFAPSAAFNTLAWSQGSTTLAAGRYYLGFTTSCSATCATIGGTNAFVSFAVNASGGASTGGALPATVTPPADSWNAGNQPTIVIH